MVNWDLPKGWKWKTLEDVCVPPQYGWTTRGISEGNLHLLRTTDITSGNVDWNTVPFCAEEPSEKEKYLLHDGDIVISRAGSVGFSHLIKNPKPAVYASYLIRFKPLINEKYVLFFLKSPSYWEAISEQSLGIAIPNVNATKLKKIQIPIAPEAEQERIVAKIDELFTQLEAGTAALRRVQAGLKRYKMAVLKAAVEGRLLDGGASVKEGELPEGWRWQKIEDIAETIGGVTKGRDLAGKRTVTLPYLRVANVQRGKLELEVIKEIEILQSEIEKYRLLSGDIVLTEGGDWDKLGRSAIWRDQIPNCIHQNHIFRARVKTVDVSPEWLMYYTNSENGQNYFKEASKQTTNLASINLTQLRACPIPIPPLEEQNHILSEVERRLSVAQEIEAVVDASLKRAGRLRQAVLKAAFEGRLV